MHPSLKATLDAFALRAGLPSVDMVLARAVKRRRRKADLYWIEGGRDQ